jgi:hypothetical protein
MKKPLIVLFAAALASVPAQAQETHSTGFAVQLKVPLEARALKGAPYSADVVTDHTQSLPDGNRIVQHTTGRVYRDAEGRVRREEDRPSGTPSISITDPVAGVSYSLDPETRIAWKTPAMTGAAIMTKLDAVKMKMIDEAKIDAMKVAEAHRRAEGGPAVTVEVNGGRFAMMHGGTSSEQHGEETLPAKVLEGVLVDGKRTTITIAAGAIGNERPISVVTEEWTSPELQVLVLTERKDPREGDSSYRLVNVTRNEPAASLFEVPAGYTIRETGLKRFERFPQDR